jgi:serine/threonine-protein kinase
MDAIAQLNMNLAGRYAVEREIGRGGMATVFLARDLRHDRLVALKLLNPELGAVLGVERFLSEIKVTANLQHPHLLPLFDSGESNGLLFYVMPYVDGESLRARLEREKQLPTEDAIGIAVAVASALEYAHEHGVIHRDLKPENILLQGGQAVVADFGIALAVSNAGGARVTQTGLSLGTPQYMSPEQATGDRVIDRRSDIYSLAAVTYEMLTGEPPHTGATMQAIIARVLTDRPRSVRSMRPNLPEHVEIALDRALEKIPADRWTSAREFAQVLQGRAAASGTRGTVSRFAVAPARGWRARLKDPAVLALAALAAAGLLFGGSQWSAAHQAEGAATVRFRLGLAAALRALPSSTQDTKVAISPDGTTMAFIGIGDGGIVRVFLRSIDDTRLRPVAGTEGALTVFFSPDGKSLGFRALGSIMRVPVGGGTPLVVAPAPGGLQGATWARNGQIVFSTNNRLWAVPEGGGSAPRLITALDSAHHDETEYQPVAIGDGSMVAYAASTSTSAATGQISVVTVATGEVRRLRLPSIAPIAFLDGSLIYATSSGVLMAARFDESKGRVVGTPVAVQTDVASNLLTGAVQAAVSRNGTLVYQSGSALSQLVLVDMHGAGTPVIPDARAYGYPRFSPDGKKIAVGINSSNRSDIWLFDIASNTPARFTTQGIVNERPEWSPDGRRILFRTDAGGLTAIWWRPSDFSEPATALLSRRGSNFFEAVISPNGRWLVYQLDTAGADVYYRALSGDTVPRPIANAPQFVEDMARVSPDGNWVAFVTDESGVQQVVVQPFPGPGARTQISTNGGAEPVWSRDGRRIFYRDNQRFVAATIRAGPALEVLRRDVLFEDHFVGSTLPHANYDVAPDGVHFLFMKPAQEAEIEVVYHWRAELRERLAGRAVAP